MKNAQINSTSVAMQRYAQLNDFLTQVASIPKQMVRIRTKSNTTAPVFVSGMSLTQFRHCIGFGIYMDPEGCDSVRSRGHKEMIHNSYLKIVTLRDYPGGPDAVTQPERKLIFADAILAQQANNKTIIALDVEPESFDFNDPEVLKELPESIIEIGTAISWGMLSYACAKSKQWNAAGVQALLATQLGVDSEFPFYYGTELWNVHQEAAAYMPVPYAYIEPSRAEGWVQTILSNADRNFNGIRSFLLHAKRRFPIYAPFNGFVSERTEYSVVLKPLSEGEIPDAEQAIGILNPDTFNYRVGDEFSAGEVLGFDVPYTFDVGHVNSAQELISEIAHTLGGGPTYLQLLENYLRAQIVTIDHGMYVPVTHLPTGASWIPQKRDLYWDVSPATDYLDSALDCFILPPLPFSRESVRHSETPLCGIIDLSIN